MPTNRITKYKHDWECECDSCRNCEPVLGDGWKHMAKGFFTDGRTIVEVPDYVPMARLEPRVDNAPAAEALNLRRENLIVGCIIGAMGASFVFTMILMWG